MIALTDAVLAILVFAVLYGVSRGWESWAEWRTRRARNVCSGLLTIVIPTEDFSPSGETCCSLAGFLPWSEQQVPRLRARPTAKEAVGKIRRALRSG